MSLSSDAFFPFRDNIDRAAQVRAVNYATDLKTSTEYTKKVEYERERLPEYITIHRLSTKFKLNLAFF